MGDDFSISRDEIRIVVPKKKKRINENLSYKHLRFMTLNYNHFDNWTSYWVTSIYIYINSWKKEIWTLRLRLVGVKIGGME